MILIDGSYNYTPPSPGTPVSIKQCIALTPGNRYVQIANTATAGHASNQAVEITDQFGNLQVNIADPTGSIYTNIAAAVAA